MNKKERLDNYLVVNGYFDTKNQAQGNILAGKVKINGEILTKAGFQINTEKPQNIEIESMPYVSRGGFKLEKALKEFNINLQDKICLDAGASTGGFTDCMLQNAAAKVYAVDVGYGQIAWKLRNSPKVVVIERTNIRNATLEEVYKNLFLLPFSLTGNELGEFNNIDDLRNAAIKHYKNNIQGTIIKHPELGKILFTGKGIDKTRNASADIRKLKSIPELSKLVKNGDFEGTLNNYKNRKDGITKFHYLRNTINIDGKPFEHRITIAKDSFGNKYYDLNDKEINPPAFADLQKSGADGLTNNITDSAKNLNPYNEIFNKFSEFCTMDLSFISITKVLSNIKNLMNPEKQELVALIKPQFEAGKELVPKSGVIKDKNIHVNVIKNIVDFASEINLFPVNLTFSPIQGPAGNIEYLIYLKNKAEYNKTEFENSITETVEKAHEHFNSNKINK